MRKTLVTLLILLPLAAQVSHAWQTERAAKQQFEAKYGARMRMVLASRATDDDVTMAQELFDEAQLAMEESQLLAIEMCEAAFVLGMRDVTGFDIGLAAMELVARTSPDKAVASREKAVAFLRRLVATGRGEERAAAVDRLMAALTRQGDELRAASDFGGAAKLYGQALKVGETEKLPDLEPLKAKLEAAAERERLELRIEAANLKLASDPTNAQAAAELLQIYLVERDDPMQALRYAKAGGDDTSKTLLPLIATSPLDSLTAAQCMAIGQWYETLSTSAPAGARSAIIKRSRTYYDQFMLRPGTDPLEQLKVSLSVRRLRDAWIKLNPEEAKSLATLGDDGWADLLTGIEPLRYRVAGSWRRGEAGVLTTATAEPARFMLPGLVSNGYEFTAKFTRTAGEGEVVFILPAGDRQARLVLSAAGGKASGLHAIAGETLDAATATRRNATTVVPGTLINDQVYTLQVRATLLKQQITFAIDLDGERYIDWTGPVTDLSLDAAWSLRAPAMFGFGAADATVLFSAARLRATTGDVTLMPKPATLAERGSVTTADGFADMIEIWDKTKDVYDGQWLRELNGLVIDRMRPGDHPRTRLPVVPEGDYTIRTRFTCMDNRRGTGGPIIYLPLKGTAAMLVTGIGQRGNLAGITLIDGKDAASNDTTAPMTPFVIDDSHTLETRVTFVDEETVRIQVDLDGKRLIRWEGPIASLTPPAAWTFGNGTSPGIGMQLADIRFDSVELRMDKGAAPLVRQPLVKAGATAADATPVEIIKAIDIKKHVLSGTWAVEGGRLVATTIGSTDSPSIVLPVAPNGNYELRGKIIRAAGRPIVQIHLPVAGTIVDLTLGANEGRTCSLAAPTLSGKDPAFRNIVSNSAIRLINGNAYSLKIKVETTGDDSSILVELEGKTYLTWKGLNTSLKQSLVPGTVNSTSPGITVTNLTGNSAARSGATFSDLELRMLTGTVKKTN